MSPKKVVFTGPESTGKSVLSKKIAAHYNSPLVNEYAREYIDQLERPYVYEDLLIMAKGQAQLEKDARSKSESLFVCDTSMLTFKIWSEDKFRKSDPWIDEYTQLEKVDLYLLCNVDIPWQYDPQREDSDRREYFFDLYKETLESIGANYSVVSGSYEERFQKACASIDALLV